MGPNTLLLGLLLLANSITFIACNTVNPVLSSNQEELLAERLCGLPIKPDTCIYSASSTLIDAAECQALCEGRTDVLNIIYNIILMGPCRGEYRKILGQCLPANNIPPYPWEQLACTGVCMLENGDITLGGLIMDILRIILPFPINDMDLDYDLPPAVLAEQVLCGVPDVANTCVYSSASTLVDPRQCQDVCEGRIDILNVIYNIILLGPCNGEYRKILGQCLPANNIPPYPWEQLACTGVCMLENGDATIGGLLLTILRIILPFPINDNGPHYGNWPAMPESVINLAHMGIENAKHEKNYDLSTVLDGGFCRGHFRQVQGSCYPAAEVPPFTAKQLFCTVLCQVNNDETNFAENLKVFY